MVYINVFTVTFLTIFLQREWPDGKGNLEMVTIKDVAKKAGVSVSAVSRALNNYTDINAKTKEKILRVVE